LGLDQKPSVLRREAQVPRTGKPAARTVQSVDRGLALLWMLADGDGDAGLGVVEASERLGVDPSTASRLLASLVAGRLAIRDPVTGRYRMGPGAARLARAAPAAVDPPSERELRQAARRTLYLLEEGTGETVVLVVPGQGTAALVDVVPSRRSAPQLAWLNMRRPLHATADGKVLLAHAPGEERPAAEPGPAMERFTPRTVTDPAALRAQLAEIRRLGYAVTEGEHQPGVNVIAAPVENATGRVAAALAIEGPAERFDRIGMRRALDLLLPRAGELSRNLGARTAAVISSPDPDPFA
jgi:DNA-binding IclR family transcriptional regulator